MENRYPSPQQAGVRIPSHVKKDRFCAGFRHGLTGGHLDKVEYMKLSFREGFPDAHCLIYCTDCITATLKTLLYHPVAIPVAGNDNQGVIISRNSHEINLA